MVFEIVVDSVGGLCGNEYDDDCSSSRGSSEYFEKEVGIIVEWMMFVMLVEIVIVVFFRNYNNWVRYCFCSW